MEDRRQSACGTDSGTETSSLADPGAPFLILKDIIRGLRFWQPLHHKCFLPRGRSQAGGHDEWGVQKGVGGVGSMTSLRTVSGFL